MIVVEGRRDEERGGGEEEREREKNERETLRLCRFNSNDDGDIC